MKEKAGAAMTAKGTSLGTLDMTCLAAPTVPGEVRQRIRLRLDAWGLAWLAPDLGLIATELITNACAAAPDGRLGVKLAREPHAVLLAVWDGSDQLPYVRAIDAPTPDVLGLGEENLDRDGGRGLHLVKALSTGCGVSRTPPAGKWVWARCAI